METKYAIVQTGGKQYKVEKGTRLQVGKLEQAEGASIELSEVLLVGGDAAGAKIGRPLLAGSAVSATIVKHLRAPKVLIFKKRSKKGYKKMQGHRQDMTEIEIQDIKG